MELDFNLEGIEKVQVYPTKVADKPLVSVCVQTYKHENFIKQCLDGILMQETNFEFEILLGEDDSPDKTREYCIEYADKYPDKIRLFLHDRSNVIYINGNPTGRYNFIYNLSNANGKYIALCEGDDYWTDPLKLQRQVDILDANKDYSLSCGAYEKLDDVNRLKEKIISSGISSDETESGYSFGLEDMKEKWLTKTLNLVFRKEALESFNFFKYTFYRDVHLNYHLLKQGKGYYFKNILGVYRVHEGGIHSMKSRFNYLHNAYLVYKELFEINRDEFCRYKYTKHSISLFHFLLYRKGERNISKLKLFKEAFSHVNDYSEKRKLIKAFNPRSIISQYFNNFLGVKM